MAHLISIRMSSRILTMWGVAGAVLESDDRPQTRKLVKLRSVWSGVKNCERTAACQQ